MTSGLELIPAAFDRRATDSPNKPWASVPLDNDNFKKGTRDISWKSAADYINRAAWMLSGKIRTSKDHTFPTVAYQGPSDLRYIFLSVALMKLGYKVLLFHASLSLDGQRNLVEKTNCKIFVHDKQYPFDGPIVAEAEVIVTAPSIASLMASGSVEVFPYSRTLREGLMDPGLVLHTSGTTGLPKPVILPFAHQAISAQLIKETPPLNGQPLGYSLFERTRLFVGFPIAHSGGVNFSLFCSLCSDVTLVLVPNDTLLGSTLKDLITHAKVTSALTMPRVLIEAAQDEETLGAMEKLKFLAWSGGHLPQDVGHSVSKRTCLMSSWGTTESGMHVLHTVEPEDWEYNHFNPVWNTLEFRPVDSIDIDGAIRENDETEQLYESVAVRNPNQELLEKQLIFYSKPEEPEWKFGDLWAKHPTKPNLWKHSGRLDDMIVLSSGHNFHPAQYERNIIAGDPLVQGCLIIGNGRPSLAIIFEVGTDTASNACIARLHERFWPLVERLNTRSNKQAQIPASNLIFTTQQKPFPRTAKGSIARFKAERRFQQEIEKVYDT